MDHDIKLLSCYIADTTGKPVDLDTLAGTTYFTQSGAMIGVYVWLAVLSFVMLAVLVPIVILFLVYRAAAQRDAGKLQ